MIWDGGRGGRDIADSPRTAYCAISCPILRLRDWFKPLSLRDLDEKQRTRLSSDSHHRVYTAVEARPHYSWTVASRHQITVLVHRRRRGLCLLPLPSPFEVQKPILADTDDERTILPDNRSLRACLLSKKGTSIQGQEPRQ